MCLKLITTKLFAKNRTCMAKPRNSVVLSVDFDFFVKEKDSYDWSHSESSPMFLNEIWAIRAMNLINSGIDPFKEVGVVGSPVDLPSDLEILGWKFKKNVEVSIAESHASAYHLLKDSENLEIVNIDAHHDIFYHQKAKLDCGNWIFHLAKEGRVNKVTVVYPLWRKDEDSDYPSNEAMTEMEKLGVKVDVVYGISETYARTVSKIFIARSGCWVPPWVDDDFFYFVGAWMSKAKKMRLWGYDSVENFRREFNKEQVIANAAVEKKLLQDRKMSCVF